MEQHVFSPNTHDLNAQNQQLRFNALQEHGMHFKAADDLCGNIVLLASLLCETPFAAVSLFSGGQQFFKAALGFPVIKITSKEDSFCSHTIEQSGVLVASNTATDERFMNNPFVRGASNIRFYAGAPLIGEHGTAIGSVCVLDVVPRGLREDQRDGLALLSNIMTLFLNRPTEMTDTLTTLNKVKTWQA